MKSSARSSHVGARDGVAGAARGGVLAGLIAVLAVAGAVAYLRLSGARLPFERPREVSEVLVIAAMPDENGDAVAQVIAKADLVRGRVSSIDPWTTVTIPGTTYSMLRDVYPFGGGESVARAVAALQAREPMPWIALSPEAVIEVMGRDAQIVVRLDEEMAVFDGERLYEFPAGTVTIAGASDLRAILNGAAYLPPPKRQGVLDDVAAGIVKVLAGYPGGLGRAIQTGVFESDLTPEEADGVAKRMGGVRGQ